MRSPLQQSIDFAIFCLAVCSIDSATSMNAIQADDTGSSSHGSPVTTLFYSRPDIRAPLLNIHVNDERASPQYIFVNPQSPFYQSGPNIYNSYGELVWAGAAEGLASNAYGFHVCDYDGSIAKHLCLFQGVQMFGYGHGYGVILNDRYKIVRVVQSRGGSDIHEFRLVDDGRRALVAKYRTRRYDFEDSFNPQGLRAVEEGIFEEIELQNDTTIFEWCSTDYIKPDSADRPIKFENGQAPTYDYFHMNSLDKNSDGDYLVGARHTSAVYKVSGIDGSIIWILSDGPESNFALVDFTIWGAHHARWRLENSTHTVLTLFNNGHDGVTSRASRSSGMVISLDHTSFQATLLKEYGHTERLGAVSKGSFQTLPNTNVFLGWGSEPHFTEYLANGTLVFHASVAGGGGIYRVFKSDWIGDPSDTPALWTYARTKQSPTTLYVSWNGATEVHTWNFYVGSGPGAVGSFVLAGSKEKDGFETNFTLPEYSEWAFAEAVTKTGMSLRNSSIVSTWMPGDILGKHCDDWKCPERESDFPVKYNLLPDLDNHTIYFQEGIEGLMKSVLASAWSSRRMITIIIPCGLLSMVVLFGIPVLVART